MWLTLPQRPQQNVSDECVFSCQGSRQLQAIAAIFFLDGLKHANRLFHQIRIISIQATNFLNAMTHLVQHFSMEKKDGSVC